MNQLHPRIYYVSPTSAQVKRVIQPTRSRVAINLDYDPKKKGLLWYRTYRAVFHAEYIVTNPTPITQTIYLSFDFPATGTRFDRFTLAIDGKESGKAPRDGSLTESVIVAAGAEVPIVITYAATGLNEWRYSFGENPRVHDLVVQMTTNFEEIDIPAGSESPTSRQRSGIGWILEWSYSDVIGAHAIGMDMPAVLNPGPVASRITYFAPVSLVFYFAVLLMVGAVRGVNLHPVNYVFLAGGLFTFQLLFAYLVDLLPVREAFAIAAAVSLILVTAYLWRVAGGRFARLAALAQLSYMILFSYSFFFRGLTGITITIGAVVTLALLMAFTAKIDWEKVFVSKPRAKPLPPGPSSPLPVPPPLT
jgi:hypothetical protein